MRHGHEGRVDHRHHRHHPIAGDGHEGIQVAQHLHLGGQQRDFLLAFAQRRGHRVAVVRLGAPAREPDLPAMLAQGLGAPGQDHLRAAVARHDAGQHRCFDRRTGRQQVAQFTVVPAFAGRRLVQRVQCAQQAFVFGQRAAQRPPQLFAQRQRVLHGMGLLIATHG
ncbi:hypothetical protein D3C72_1699190 [compost metagenome]